MAHSQEITELLAPWQKVRFRDSEITLQDAIDSLNTDSPLVVAKPVSPAATRWMLYRTDTGKIAFLTFAGIWLWNAPLETGNFVPDGETTPLGVPEQRIQNQPNYMCDLAFAFDTSVDDSLWRHIRALEDHAKSRPNFNRALRNRRPWQSGRDPSTRNKYVMQAKVFAKRTPLNTRDTNSEGGHEYIVPYEIHPWLLRGLRDYPESQLIPNPNRPMYYAYADGVIRKLHETNQPNFGKHDIVRVAFTVAFVIGGVNWYPEIIPIEFTKVGQIPEHLTTNTDLSAFPSLSSDFAPLESGSMMTLITPTTLGKRKTSEESLSDYSRKKKATIDHEAVTDESDSATPGDKESADPDAIMTDAPPMTDITNVPNHNRPTVSADDDVQMTNAETSHSATTRTTGLSLKLRSKASGKGIEK